MFSPTTFKGGNIMKILWNSSSPLGVSGYGICTRELVRRLIAEGHSVRIATKHAYFGWHEWEGVEIFDGTHYKHVKFMLDDEDFDYIFSHWDIWVMKKERFPKDKWVGYIPVDTPKISDGLSKVVKDVGQLIGLSRHGQQQLKEATGRDDIPYAPHGVDTSVFKPSAKARKAFRDGFGWDDDIFVIGTVGLNYVDDRKGFITLLRAFKDFHKRYPKSVLYIHAHAMGYDNQTIGYFDVIKSLGIADCVAWPHQPSYDLRRIDDEWLNEVYNGFDVFCLPTAGEGFGLPLIEAQACGIPVITTDVTTGSELAGKTGWLIDVHEDDLDWINTGAWRYKRRPSEVLKCLELAHSAWKLGNYRKIKDKALAFGKSFDWDLIWDKYWRPVFKGLEARLEDNGNDKD